MRKFISLLVLACFILPQFAYGGAWTLPKNSIWAETSLKGSWAKDDFSAEKDRHRKANHGSSANMRDPRSWGKSTNVKVEYGLLDQVTLLGGAEYKHNTYKEYSRPSNWGPYSFSGNAWTTTEFGARVRIYEKPVVVSTQVKAFFYSGNGDDKIPALTDGNSSLEFRIMASRKFETEVPFYLSSELGYKFNNRNVCNHIPFFLEGGFWPVNWLLIKSEIDGIWSHDGTGNLEKEYAIWRIGPTIQLLDVYNALTGNETSTGESVTLEGKSINLGLQYGNTFWGRNTSADHEFIGKISFQY